VRVPLWSMLQTGWVLVDGALVFASYIVATYLRFGAFPAENFGAVMSDLPWLTAAAALSFALLGSYSLDQRDHFLAASKAGLGVAFTSILAAALAFWLRSFSFPRGVILIAFPIHLMAAVLWHRAMVSFARRRLQPRRTLIAGLDAAAIHMLRKVWDASKSGFRVVAACPPGAVSALGRRDLEGVDAVFIGPNCSRGEHGTIMRAAQAAGTDVYLVPGLEEVFILSAQGCQIDDLPLLRLRPLGLTPPQLLVKRVFDVILGGALFLLLMLPMGGIAALVAATSRGPVLIRQTRVGTGDGRFTLFKFRTMVQDAEDGCGPVLSRAHDPRVTPLGRHLRALRLDELPQLLNVLRGDMGLVGPRPERPEFVDQFQEMLSDYHLRRLMPPGIMGLAQLAGHYGTLPQDKLRYDLFYIRNWSLWLDIRIILQTLRFVAAGGAEHGLPSSGEVPGDLEKFLRGAGVPADTARG